MNPWWKCTLVLSEANLKVRCHNIHSIRIVYKYTHKYTVKDAAERTIAERVSWLTSAHWMVNTFFFLNALVWEQNNSQLLFVLVFPKVVSLNVKVSFAVQTEELLMIWQTWLKGNVVI